MRLWTRESDRREIDKFDLCVCVCVCVCVCMCVCMWDGGREDKCVISIHTCNTQDNVHVHTCKFDN